VTQAQIAAELTTDAILYSGAASAAFLAFAVILNPRLWRTPIGRSLIMLDAGLLALYAPSVLHRFAGLSITNAAFAWYYLATLLTVGTAIWWRTLIMIRAQLKGRNDRGGSSPD
jgi:hypothetical protein